MINALLGLSPIFPTPLDARELGWGLLLGKDDGFSRELKQLTKSAGVTHLTAASGANISLFQGLLWPLQGMFWIHVGLEFVVIVLYWNLSGASGSLWRASVLALFNLGSRLSGRPTYSPWLLSLVVLLALGTQWRESLGFWLSWLAVIGVYLSQYVLSGEKKNILSPQMWGFCKWTKSTLLSGVFVLVLVSFLIYRVFGEWQPQGLVGTIVSTPFVPLYLLLFVTQFLLKEGNKVALKIWQGRSFSFEFVPGFLETGLQLLLSVLFFLWHLVAMLPSRIVVTCIVIILGWSLQRIVRMTLTHLQNRRVARQWGWQM